MQIKFNSHKNHNPYCDILEGTIDKDSFLTYVRNIADGSESCEYYRGKNYVPDSTLPSYSRYYKTVQDIPKKYFAQWLELKNHYIENYL